MKYSIHFLINLLVLQFFVADLSAQLRDSVQVFHSTDSVVVIGNRIPTSVRNLAYSYQNISAEMVRQFTTHSVLEAVDLSFPTAFVFENKVLGFGVGVDGAGTMNLRGIGGKPNTGVLVLVNGHPDFMGLFGHPLPDVYGNEDIQRVEVLAGPSSTVFGDHALGGVVNLVTEPGFKHQVKFRSEAGSFNTRVFSLSLQKKIRKHGLFFTARRQHSDGHIEQTRFKSLHLQGGWQFRLNPEWKLLVQGRYVPYEFDDPARGTVDNGGLGIYGKIRRGSAEVSLQNQNRRTRGAFQLYSNMGKHEFYDGFTSTDFTYGLSAYQMFEYSTKIAITGGADVTYYGGKAHNDFARLPNGQPVVNPDRHRLTAGGVYGVFFFTPYPALNFKGGLRYQHTSLPLNNLSPFAGVSYSPTNTVQFYANYQTGFRTPTPMELYLFPSANADLKEEKVQSAEIGTTLSLPGAGEFRLSFFRNKATDLIQALPGKTPPPPTVFVNGPESEQWGAEVSLQQRLFSRLGIHLAYGYLEPDLLTAYNPKHQFKYTALFREGGMSINIYGKFVRKLFAGNDSQMPLPDYNVFNTRIAYRIKQIELELHLLNLLDRNYLAREDFPAPGRQIRLGFTFRLE